MEAYRGIRIDDYAVVWVTQEGAFMAPVVPDIRPFEEWLAKNSVPANT